MEQLKDIFFPVVEKMLETKSLECDEPSLGCARINATHAHLHKPPNEGARNSWRELSLPFPLVKSHVEIRD